MTGARAVLWLVIATAMVASACSSPAAEPPTPSVTSERTTATTSAPSPEELAADAATEALAAVVEVLDAALQDPAGRDWEPEIRLVAGDPYASTAVDGIRTYATGGIRQVGNSMVESEVTAVDLEAQVGPTVEVVACYDNTDSDIVRVDNGESILGPDDPQRFVWNLTVTQYASTPGEPWLVTVLEPHPDQPC